MTTIHGPARRPAFFRMAVVVFALAGCQQGTAQDADAAREGGAGSATHAAPAAAGPTGAGAASEASAEAGRYLTMVAGCNDCHTDGYLPSGGQIPEEQWLTGSVVGLRGPWGTTYPANLRLTVQNLTEDEWVTMLATRTTMPPMPWPSVAAMTDVDRRSLYRYLRSLGAAGERAPANLPPGQTPAGPWMDFEVHNLPAQTLPAPPGS